MSSDAHVEFQYRDAVYESETAVAGMWLFLATEALFFGGLFLTWLYYRYLYPTGFAEAARESEFGIGTANTVILLTSSLVYACGLPAVRLGAMRLLFWLSVGTMALGTLFLLLKIYEWKIDVDDHMVPGRGFAISGANAGSAQLFWIFYYVGTVLHAIHLTIGIGLVGWIALRTRRGDFTPARYTAVEVVGLYWSFVDMVWLVLYALIYLAGRAG